MPSDYEPLLALWPTTAKLFATQACTRITERALHYHGATGFMSDSPVQRFYRNCKVFEFGEGSSELQREMIAPGLGL